MNWVLSMFASLWHKHDDKVREEIAAVTSDVSHEARELRANIARYKDEQDPLRALVDDIARNRYRKLLQGPQKPK